MDIEEWNNPPTGGRGKMILLGIVLPLAIACFATKIWIDQETIWPLKRGYGRYSVVRNETARALAVCYFSIAAFAHSRWFWGMLPSERAFKYGMIGSMIFGLAAALMAFVYAMA